ncbi:hypothetical protein [Streptomyces sp. NPDC020667]|uniref:hypothetical protein n=1 Tax=Streptomyces sp. NPDC020667 TaxID=3154895 RepID=UPI00340BA864
MPGTHTDERRENELLAHFLRLAGMSPEKLARQVNAVLAELPGNDVRPIHEKTPYGWLNGQTPREPVPDAVALVLAEKTGQPVDVQALFPGRRCPARPLWLPADHGMALAWDRLGLLAILDGWMEQHMLGRRAFIAITGTALTTPAWTLLDTPTPDLAVTRTTGRVREPVVQFVEETVALAQQMDDQQGSALAFVSDQFRAVVGILRRDSYDTPTGRRLATAAAQLAQTAGFMAYESRKDGEAQRWYLTGLRAAHAADDRPLAASILSLMSNQAATLGKHGDALQLADAAQEAAANAPAPVQALVHARSGLAHAAAGDIGAFRRTRDDTLTQLDTIERHPTEPGPRWAYYVSPIELDAIAGRSLVILARRVPARQNRLLPQAEDLLRARALNDDPAFQRSALRHSAWLALAHTQRGEIDQAVTCGERALERLPAVTSSRATGLLWRLREDLEQHALRATTVRSFLTQLDRQLGAAQ